MSNEISRTVGEARVENNEVARIVGLMGVENNQTLWIGSDARVENSSPDRSVRSMARSGTEGAHQNPEVKHSERETAVQFVNVCVPEREMARTFCPMSLSGSERRMPETDAALAGTEGAPRNREATLSAP